MAEKNIVVIGTGVSGLTTALLLSQDPQYRIVVAAKHMPGDYDKEYASPWAAYRYEAVKSQNGREALGKCSRISSEIALVPAFTSKANCEIHQRAKDVGTPSGDGYSELSSVDPWFKTIVLNFHQLDTPSDADSATLCMSVCINTAIYLPWLVSQCLERKVTFKRKQFKHVRDAAAPSIHPAEKVDLVVNCSGLMASKLGAVEDDKMYPARGQVVLVRNESDKIMGVTGTHDSGDEP
ncbi:uncharacterized protein PV07_08701 [Cladophialophora immunda]|uniref:FAD dependent oxidoreductase domain-containing protein n=1 Tax=Cladophialophora immunda TaxID=569365 RepID=A0A0D2C528_9EURO|nr:uncharacterized protein PV07_08701 [Cladophialophora immunda]KIW25535.1 hypothetical protein PV07_08701 [Cladophialophora immunda]